ncbi:hypothetical protein [Clostridium yunnanense]|nr:hypothetical protein [Clostridium yunnanense]
MVKIGLFCATGTSTSVLVSKIIKSAEEKVLEFALEQVIYNRAV